MMKKIIMLCVFYQCILASFAQNTGYTTAWDLIRNNSHAIGLDEGDLENSIISNAYFNKMSGTYLVYLQQSYLDLPVFNEITTLAFKNGELVSMAGDKIKSIDKRTRQAGPVPLHSAESAAKAALALKNIYPTQPLVAVGKGPKIEFGKLAVTREKITAELMWVPMNEGKDVVLGWQINLSPLGTADNWLIRLDAATNELIGETNLTVYCNFDNLPQREHRSQPQAGVNGRRTEGIIPSVVNGASYRVVPYPAESPSHAGGAPELRTNPWILAPGNATSLKWHNDGAADYYYTRGNNVWAYQDRLNENTTGVSRSAASTSAADPLIFEFLPDFSITPIQNSPVPNQQFNITNLFYWNNIIHDLSYQYGFDEPAGNFQASNQGRGGLGNDFVRAEAQDGSGTGNANFNSPSDGGSGIMQMYLWGGSPQRDGDVDNGIIVHEFTHGISARLTGGPSQSGCLGNNEQMGEGWSDYFALMATQNWASSATTDGFTNPRGIGTYASGQPVSGPGIRPRRYTTNMAINEMTYANLPQQVAPHGVGFIWCTMLWDMTWEIIQQAGINPNLFDPSGAGGNTVALKLVTEGMKLQPCSPGFVDGRDAILRADQLLYGGLYHCAITRAFARRGLGYDANQGSSNSHSDGTAGFSTIESGLYLSQDVTAQKEGLNVTYNNKVVAGPCAAITNYVLTDTLPLTVTYVSGGTYNSLNRVVSFAVNIAAGQKQDYAFTVKINNGTWFPTVNLFEDNIDNLSLPSAWTASSTTGPNWTASNARSHTAPNSYYSANPAILSEQFLTLTNALSLGASPPPITFWHWFNTESNYDGAILESSIDDGVTWKDMGSSISTGNYTGTMATNSNSPIGGRPAWTGRSNGFMKTEVNLDAYANQHLKIRFHNTTDDGTNAEGWYVDDIALKKFPNVDIRSNLFNANGLIVNQGDSFTVILQTPACTPVAITKQPANAVACDGSNVVFGVEATGTSPGYQWQQSTNGGFSYSNIAGANAAILTVDAVSNNMNNNMYRVLLDNNCPSAVTSTGATLTISNKAVISTQPADMKVCVNANTSLSASALGSSLTFQWQVSTDGGVTFSTIPAATKATLSLTAVGVNMDKYKYRMLAFSCGPDTAITNTVTLAVLNPANIVSQPVNATLCPSGNASFTVLANGTDPRYQWQVSADAGISFTNIPQATTTFLNVPSVSLAMNDYRYRVIINDECTQNLVSAAAILKVNMPVTITTILPGNAACQGTSTSFSVSAAGNALTYQWQESVNGGLFADLPNSAMYSGVNSPTLNIPAVTASMNGNAYRVTVTGAPCGAVNSPASGLVVYPLPSVHLNTNSRSLTPATSTTLVASPIPGGNYSYQWYLNDVLMIGSDSATFPVYIDGTGNYKVAVTDRNGCTALSNVVSIVDSLSSDLFVYPNPSNGRFQVRHYNSTPGIDPERTILVYDAKGSCVFSKQYQVQEGYSRMNVNIPAVQPGIYLLELRGGPGKRLGKAKILVQ
jgi:hypothetical protein